MKCISRNRERTWNWRWIFAWKSTSRLNRNVSYVAMWAFSPVELSESFFMFFLEKKIKKHFVYWLSTFIRSNLWNKKNRNKYNSVRHLNANLFVLFYPTCSNRIKEGSLNCAIYSNYWCNIFNLPSGFWGSQRSNEWQKFGSSNFLYSRKLLPIFHIILVFVQFCSFFVLWFFIRLSTNGIKWSK